MKEQSLNWNKIRLAKKHQLDGLNPEELKLFRQWESTDAEFAQAVKDLASRKTWKEDLDKLDSIDQNLAWARFSQNNFPLQNPRQTKSLGSWYRAAAVFVGVVFCSTIWWVEFSKRNAQEPEYVAAGSFGNKLGIVSTFFLPDSTQVWLSSGSELHYEENFTTNRRVRLQGEAFFKVWKNPDYPFEIGTDSLMTRVLGTSFNLKAYAGETIDLSVYSGKVQFGRQAGQTEWYDLSKDQKISWSGESGFSEIKEFDSSIAPDWKSGVFRFENATLHDIVNSIDRWYPVEFKVYGNSGSCRFSGEFHRSSLEQILEILSYTLNLSYQIHENTVQIKSKPC